MKSQISKSYFVLLALLICHFSESAGQLTDHWETIFYSDSEFKYLSSSEGIPDQNWRNPSFDDSSWNSGPGGFGYEDGDDNTIIPGSISIAIRKTFQIHDTATITDAVLHMDYDDAFVAYLNGTEVARSDGLTGDYPAYNQASSYNHEAQMYTGGMPDAFIIKRDELMSHMKEGENLLAVQVHNTSLTSSDMSAIIFFTVGLSTSSQQYLSTPSWFEAPFAFESSSLPIILIDTEGQSIPDEPKITAGMKIIYNGNGNTNHIDDTPNEYEGYIGIEVRGASSAGYPQTPYSLETRDALGENRNVALLGMPRENDWVLLSHYNEKTFMRNPLSFYLFQEMGHYATRTRLVEVVLNGQYQGIYLFGEKVKRDRYRVDIQEILPHNNSGDSLTGGYIFKTEYYSNQNTWLSDYSPYHHPSYNTHFAYYYPKWDEISEYQKNYIKFAVDRFQQILQQDDFADYYADYIDVQSFIDYFIISEVSRNVDGYKKSRYLHKQSDSKGGLIYSGPVWDFDWAWKNIYDCEMFRNTDGSGWAYKINDCLSNPSPGWMTRLLEDPIFANRLHCRYSELRRGILSNESVTAFMDSIYSVVNDAQVNHYKRWKILGVPTGAPEVDPVAPTYDAEVAKLKNWIFNRLLWLDANMPGSDEYCDTVGLNAHDPALSLRMFPNPASELLYVESDHAMKEILLISTSGKTVIHIREEGSFSKELNVDKLYPGLYLVKVATIDGDIRTAKLLIE